MKFSVHISAVIAAALVLLVPTSEACTRAFPTYTVKPDFAVRVSDRGKPLGSIEVEISREIREPEFHFETVIWNKTNEKGELLVHLPAGTYFIRTRNAGIEGEEAAELNVSDSVDALSELGLHWPAHTIFTLREIKGILAAERDPSHPFEKSNPLTDASVLLMDALSGQQIGATVSDDHGNFRFAASVASGLYILRISERGLENKDQDTLIQGNIFVEVDDKAANREMPKMSLMMTTCGLSAWTDRENLVTF